MFKCKNQIKQVCMILMKRKLKIRTIMIKKKKMKISFKIFNKKLKYKKLMKAFLIRVFNLKITKIHLWLVQEATMQINYYKSKVIINKLYKIQVKISWESVLNCKKLFTLQKEMQIKLKGHLFKIKKLFMIL